MISSFNAARSKSVIMFRACGKYYVAFINMPFPSPLPFFFFFLACKLSLKNI